MHLNLASAVLCSNSTATCPGDICQTIYDITEPCCPGCGSRTFEALTQWIEGDHPYVRPPKGSTRRETWKQAAKPRTLNEIFKAEFKANRKIVPLEEVVAERSTNDGPRNVARATT